MFLLLGLLASAAAPTALSAQLSDGVVRGRVVDEGASPLPGVDILLVGPSADSARTTTGPDGAFAFGGLVPGASVVSLQLLGHETASVRVDVRGVVDLGTITMTTAALDLDGIGVTVERADQTRDAPVGATVLDARDVSVQMATSADILDRSAGVRVRQEGGLGSEANISIHGLSGRQVRVFVDGIPAEVLGPAGSVATIPAVGLERIDVFKGVVPAEFGADALGGALNVVTSSDDESAIHVAAGAGSFGGRQLSGRGQWRAAEDVTLRLSVSHSRSENDYPVEVSIPNEFNQPEPVQVRRFHDGYSLTSVQSDVEVRSLGPLDRTTIRVLHSRERDEVQHNAFMTQPYGLAVSSGAVTGGVLSTESVSGDGRVAASGTLAFTRVGSELVDTALSVFAWDGSVLRERDYGGEISASGSLRELDTDHTFGRVGATVGMTSRGSVSAYLTSTLASRSGIDRRAADFYGQDPYSFPSRLRRSVLGFQYEHGGPSDLVSATVGVKLYDYASSGSAVENGEIVAYPDQTSRSAGWLAAVRLSGPRAAIRASVEFSTRLPEVSEVFGDLVVVRPNPALRPERSRNANVQVDAALGPLRLAVGGFIRDTDDIVFLRSSQFFAQHQNLLAALAVGTDASIGVRLTPWASVSAEGTWQDLRNRTPLGACDNVADRYRDARLPNIPYLFGNARLDLGGGDATAFGVPIHGWWVVEYVHEFFLHWEIDGRADSKAVIPEQRVHSTGVALGSESARVLIQLQNVLDTPAFDVYSVQRPGRALQLQFQTKIPSRF